MAKKTPVRTALQDKSTLRPEVVDGLDAVEASHHKYFAADVRTDFSDSLDLDKAMKAGREQENRWDYLLGHHSSGKVVGVEPHSAKQDQVQTVIKKRSAALVQLKDHLRDGTRVDRWLWVASGNVHFADTEKSRRLLDQNGIQFVGKSVAAKHLPEPSTSANENKAGNRSRKR